MSRSTFDDGRDLITGLANGEFTEFGLQHPLHGTARRQHRRQDHRRHRRRQAVRGQVGRGRPALRRDPHRAQEVARPGQQHAQRRRRLLLRRQRHQRGRPGRRRDLAYLQPAALHGRRGQQLPAQLPGVRRAQLPGRSWRPTTATCARTARPTTSPWPPPAWNPLQSYRVSEKTNAFYVQADLSGERWNGDVGVRLVKTSTSAQAWDAQDPQHHRERRVQLHRRIRRPDADPAGRRLHLRAAFGQLHLALHRRPAAARWARPRPWPARRWTSWRRPTPPKACRGASSPRSTAATST